MKTSELCTTGLCEGYSQVIAEFPAQRASDAENASILWRYHDLKQWWPMLLTHVCVAFAKSNIGISTLNTLMARRNCSHFPGDIFIWIFVNEFLVWISIKFPLNLFPKGPINNIPALVQIMSWHRSGDKPLYETMMVRLLKHIYASLYLSKLTFLPLKRAISNTIYHNICMITFIVQNYMWIDFPPKCGICCFVK